MGTTTLALVGAAGGAGTTRTAVELAAMGARDGRDVAVVDAAFTTQGLSEYVSGRIGTDLTALVTDETDAPLSDAAYAPATDASPPGTVTLVPARAPFERVARAKTAEAARELEDRVAAASETHDAVIVDVAPVAANEAVAAVTTADRVAGVYPATPHGRDALQRLRGRVADVGHTVEATVAVETRGVDPTDADAGADAALLPSTDPAVASAPVAATGHDDYSVAIAEAYGHLFETAVGVAFEEEGLIESLR